MEQNLGERQERILLAVIKEYIDTAEPVGSRTIARKYNLSVSPATIRNEMNDLENMGFLEQPHTSAGRVPSDRGYRYYVDHLMEKDMLSARDIKYITERLNRKLKEIEEIIKVTADTISDLTNYITVVLGPTGENLILERIELIPVEGENYVLIVIFKGGLVEHQLLYVPQYLKEEEIELIGKILSSHLKGYTLERVKRDILRNIYDDLGSYRKVVRQILDAIEKVSKKEESLYFRGTANILGQPEFRDVEAAQKLLLTLSRPELVKNVFRENQESELKKDLIVRIGIENSYEELRKCSLITSSYLLDGYLIGTLSVLGPTRMHYSKVVSLLEFIAEEVSSRLEKLYAF